MFTSCFCVLEFKLFSNGEQQINNTNNLFENVQSNFCFTVTIIYCDKMLISAFSMTKMFRGKKFFTIYSSDSLERFLCGRVHALIFTNTFGLWKTLIPSSIFFKSSSISIFRRLIFNVSFRTGIELSSCILSA